MAFLSRISNNLVKHWGSKHVRIGLSSSSNSPIFQSTRSMCSSVRRLYIGNLPYEMNERELREAFQPFGQLKSVRVATGKDVGVSQGFGFVTIEPPKAAEIAIDAMDGKEICGPRIIVKSAIWEPVYDVDPGYDSEEWIFYEVSDSDEGGIDDSDPHLYGLDPKGDFC